MEQIAIHSVPRSGSTWLGAIFDSHPNVTYKLQPLFSYALKGFLTPQSSKYDIENFFNKLEGYVDDFMDQKEGKERGIIPIFEKCCSSAVVYKEVRYHNILENLLYRHPSVKVVGLIRNPLSVISSWLKAPKEFRLEQGWTANDEWRFARKKNLDKPEEYNGFEKWKEVAHLFDILAVKFPNRFCLINYSDLLENTVDSVDKLFSFCGLSVPQQTLDFLVSSTMSQQKDAYSVYRSKKKDDDWKLNLPSNIAYDILNDRDFVFFNHKYKWVK